MSPPTRRLAVLALGALLALGARPTSAQVTYYFPGVPPAGDPGNQVKYASALFETSGTNLIVTVSNLGGDVQDPADVLTAVFFDISGNPTLTGTSAVVPAGSTVLFGGTDPGNVVGGEWEYGSSLTNGTNGAKNVISSAGFGLTGTLNLFPGTNLQGPASVDGGQYGITSKWDNPLTGNAKVTGGEALIKYQVVFTLSGLTSGFVADKDTITNVQFQYGTALGGGGGGGGSVPTPPAMLVMLAGGGAAWFGVLKNRLVRK